MTRSPRAVSVSWEPVPITHPSPITVRPARRTPGWSTVSRPTVTVVSTYVAAGSTTVTPAVMSASRVRERRSPSSAASCRRSLTPATSRGSAHAHGLDPAPAPRQLADHVRQVHLALRVGGRAPGDGLERRPQAARVEAVDPRVALAAAPLGRRRIALLDDGADTAVPAAADAPVAGGVGAARTSGGWRPRAPPGGARGARRGWPGRAAARPRRGAGARWPSPAPRAAPGGGRLPCPGAPAARRSAPRGRRGPRGRPSAPGATTTTVPAMPDSRTSATG